MVTATTAITSRFLFFAAALISFAIAHDKPPQQQQQATVSYPPQQPQKQPTTVTYDGRSLIINGKRELLYSGSVHYPRSTPEMWCPLLNKSREGGLNVIQTYVFWNIHEPVQGQYNFEGQYDIVKFLKTVHDNKMWATVRVGPFIQAEWNYGGIPYWLREIKNMTFRSDNGPFKAHMETYVRMIVEKLREAKLFAPQGGPIILMQIENEYNTIQRAYREKGHSYVEWAGNFAVNLNVGVPWVMCKQFDAPDPVINTCNGRHCGDTFTGPNKPYKPSLWTENWTAQFRSFGDPPSQRSAEDIAYGIARWFSKNGSLANYYMYHGGTNFGRTAAHFITPRYYDEGPLDEYGFEREPKYGHLKELHKALDLCRKPLFEGKYGFEKIDADIEFRTYKGDGFCAAFLSNNATSKPQTVKFMGTDYFLPSKAVAILPDCKTVVYNSQMVNAIHNSRTYTKSDIANKKLCNWEFSRECIPTADKLPLKHTTPLELYSLTKDTTDYGIYATSINFAWRDLPMKKEVHPVLVIASLGHGLHAYVNGEYVGTAHGNHLEKAFVFQKPINLNVGDNQIVLLGYHTGFPDSGAYMEKRFAGPRTVEIEGLNAGTLDITRNGWGHQIGLHGEKTHAYTEEGSKNMKWEKLNKDTVRNGLTWYRTYFDAPDGTNPVAMHMKSMGKGQMWVNGKSLGRHWVTFLSPLGEPSQVIYHIPRSFLKPNDNLLVILEEEPNVKPEDISIVVVDRDTVCSYVKDNHPPPVSTWDASDGKFKQVIKDAKPIAHLACPHGKQIAKVEFASYGDPIGACGNLIQGNCTAPNSQQVIEKYCLGKTCCEVPVQKDIFDKVNGACSDDMKTLAIQVKCAYK